MKKIAATLKVGDKVTGGPHGPAVIVRGPIVSQRWSPGMVHFEAEDQTGRVYRLRLQDTQRVEVAK